MKNLKENTSPFITISRLITMLEDHTPVPLRLEANLELKVLCPGPDPDNHSSRRTRDRFSHYLTARLQPSCYRDRTRNS